MPVVIRAWLADPVRLFACALLVFLVAAAVTVPVDRKGDGSEYILAAESLYYDRDLAFVPSVDLARHLMHRSPELSTPDGLACLWGRDGVERYGLHSFYYPLLAVPFYAVFGHTGFQILNALCLWGMLLILQRWLSRSAPPLVALGFATAAVFLSAAWSYLFWTQTEVFYTALLTAFLYGWFCERPWLSAIAGGILFVAQPPLALFGLAYGVDLLRARAYRRLALSAAVMLAFAAPQLFYNVYFLGTWVPMSKIGLARADMLSVPALLFDLLDPSVGFVWFYPIWLFCLVRGRFDQRRIWMLVAAFGALLTLTMVRNLYSHQVGVRYGNYLLPVFLFLIDELRFTGWPSRLALGFAIVLGAGLAINPLGNSHAMDIRPKTFAAYRVAQSFSGYYENPEVFAASSLALIPNRIHVRDLTLTDHWTLGGDETRFLLLGLEPGRLKLNVRTRPTEMPQVVELRTQDGQTSRWLLEPGQSTEIWIDIGPPNLRLYPRWERSYVYLDVVAEPWVPAFDSRKSRAEELDFRRLGVLIERIQIGDQTMFPAPAQAGAQR